MPNASQATPATAAPATAAREAAPSAAAAGGEELVDGLKDPLMSDPLFADMNAIDFKHHTYQVKNRRSGPFQRIQSLVDGVGMAARMADAAGPAKRDAAMEELLATAEAGINRMHAWRSDFPKDSRWKKMVSFLTDMTKIRDVLQARGVASGGEAVIGNDSADAEVAAPDPKKLKTAAGEIDRTTAKSKDSADDYEDDPHKAIFREGLDVLGAPSDNTAAGADSNIEAVGEGDGSHQEYVDLNGAGNNAMQIGDGFALASRGGFDIGLGLRQMKDGQGREKAEGAGRVTAGAGAAGQGLTGAVAATSSSKGTVKDAGQGYGASGMVGSTASGLLGLNDMAKSGTKLAQDHGSMSTDEVGNEAGKLTKGAVDVSKAGADAGMNFHKAVGASSQAIGTAAQVSGGLAVASGGIDVITGLLSMAKSQWRKSNLKGAKKTLADAKFAASEAKKDPEIIVNTAEEYAEIAEAKRYIGIHRAAAQAAKEKQAATPDPALKAKYSDEETRHYGYWDAEQAKIEQVEAKPAERAAKVKAIFAEITSLESELQVGPGGGDAFDALAKVHGRSQERAALKAAQGTLSVVSGALILSGVGAPVAIGIAAFNGLVTVGGMVVAQGRKSKADTLMKLASRMTDSGTVSGSESDKKADYRDMESRFTESYYRYYDHAIMQEHAPGFTSGEWSGVRNFVAADKTFGKPRDYSDRVDARTAGRENPDARTTQGVLKDPKKKEQKSADKVNFNAHKSSQARDASNTELAEAIIAIAISAFDHNTQAFIPTDVTGTGGKEIRSSTAQALLSNIGVSESTWVNMWRKNGGCFAGDPVKKGGDTHAAAQGPDAERMLADVKGKIESL